jgi:hypothetical protein
MADYSEAGSGQSNRIRRDGSAYGAATTAFVLPMVREIIDPTQAEATLGRIYTEGGADNGKPMFTGTGMAFDNNPVTIAGDNYAGTAAMESFVRWAAPLDTARFLDWPNYPLTDRGSAITTYLAALSAPAKAAAAWIYYQHSEYDSQGFSLNGGIVLRDHRVLEFSARRFIGAFRTALGKTAAQLPCLFSVPIPFSNGTNDGMNMCMRAFEALVADRAFNARFVVRQAMDCDWNGDGGALGEYQSHGSNADIHLLARRSALGIANVMGPSLAPTNNTLRAWRGPRIVHAQWVNTQLVRVWIEHDGGADLTLPATATAGWRVEYAGAPVAVTDVTRHSARSLDLALATACPIAAATRVFYNWGNARTMQGGAVYDDQDTWDAKVLPAAITGANRIKGALNRTGWAGLVTSTAAARAGSLLAI